MTHNAHQHHSNQSAVSWATAAQATLHCLTGCALGEVLGMVVSTALDLSNLSTVVLSTILAFLFGYSLTMRSVLHSGVPFRNAMKIAFAADTISIAVMEVIDNTAMLAIPGAIDAGLSTFLFWWSLAATLALAFVAAAPVNRWLISRGKGHAVMHGHH